MTELFNPEVSPRVGEAPSAINKLSRGRQVFNGIKAIPRVAGTGGMMLAPAIGAATVGYGSQQAGKRVANQTLASYPDQAPNSYMREYGSMSSHAIPSMQEQFKGSGVTRGGVPLTKEAMARRGDVLAGRYTPDKFREQAVAEAAKASSATQVKPAIDIPASPDLFPLPPKDKDTYKVEGTPSAAIPSIAKPEAQPLREMTAQETWDSRSVDPRTALQHADDDLAKQGVLWTDRRSPAMLGIKQTMADKEVAQQNTLRTGIQSRIKDELTTPDTSIHNKALMYNQDVASTGLADLREAEASKHTSDAAKSKKETENMSSKAELQKEKLTTDMFNHAIAANSKLPESQQLTIPEIWADINASLQGKQKKVIPEQAAIPSGWFKAGTPKIERDVQYVSPTETKPANMTIGRFNIQH